MLCESCNRACCVISTVCELTLICIGTLWAPCLARQFKIALADHTCRQSWIMDLLPTGQVYSLRGLKLLLRDRA